MATFGHITRERCAHLGHALTAAGLAWEDNGNQDRPELLTYTVTDPHGRRWTVDPARCRFSSARCRCFKAARCVIRQEAAGSPGACPSSW